MSCDVMKGGLLYFKEKGGDIHSQEECGLHLLEGSKIVFRMGRAAGRKKKCFPVGRKGRSIPRHEEGFAFLVEGGRVSYIRLKGGGVVFLTVDGEAAFAGRKEGMHS
jgi:hypothetical protein